MPQLTPEDAADRLGIADENVEVFVRLVDALRTPEARDAEVDRLRAELAAVDEALVQAGITYPLGARGVRDLGGALRMAREDEEGADDA
ncbi:hypothetical protein [Streptomyces sp. NBC_00038]|uniref:hypothetical protein n=1 Tax=Streptomyces sp. NBC_00038 TaxID=2903615 RepID=UPI00224EA579|nr:hypothetical protein [Streptomyces sp. NBC_00038]MCX5562735.1 hypothetical protein [Streptomyces sp. NBC_00038]MCX5563615.1 hypothetical protein [Streptomyces sp. NBC_00038]